MVELNRFKERARLARDSQRGRHVRLARDRFNGKPLRHPGEVVYVEANGAGPNSPHAALKRYWYEN